MKNRMKIMKKIGSLLIIVTLLTGLTSGVMVSADETSSFAGSNAEGLLKYLNIIDVEEDAYQEGVTRGQLADIAAKVMNADKYEDAGLYFDDVPVGSKYYSSVTALVKACVVAGDGGREYRPDDVATLNEACKIFSVILGYGDIAEFTSYLQTARKAGVLDGVGMDNFVTYEEALRMAYNTLHADMLDITGVTVGEDTEINFEVAEGYHAIERYYGLRRCKGVVSGAAGTTLLAADNNIGDDQIKVGNKIFNWSDPSLLGKAIIFYCNVEEKRELGKDIAYACVDEDRTNIITIDGQDSLGANNRTSEFNYYTGDKKVSAKLKGGYDIIYNGRCLTNETANDLKPSSGIVTLIDNNGDKVFDVISVEAYEYIRISKIDLKKGELFSDIPQGKSYGSTTRTVKFSVYNSAGKKIRPQLATVGSIAAVRVSKSNQGTIKINMNILDVVSGNVERISGDKIVVAGKEFKWVDATQGEIAKNELRLGDVVEVYGHNGFLGMIMNATKQDYQYGYLLDAANVDKSSFETDIKFMLITHSLEKVVVDATKKVELDGVMTDNWTTIQTRLTETAANVRADATGQFPLSQLVRYRLNSKGELNGLDTNYFDGSVEDPELSLVLYENTSEINRYAPENNSFYTLAVVDGYFDKLHFTLLDPNNCIVVCDNVRDDELSYRNVLNTSWLQLGGAGGADGQFRDNWDNGVTIEVYNVDPDKKTGGFVVCYVNSVQGSDSIPNHRPVSLVLGSSETLDENGNVAKTVETIDYGGNTTTLYISEDYAGTSQFNIGDLIQTAKTDARGHVVNSVDIYTTAGGWNPPTIENKGTVITTTLPNKYFSVPGGGSDYEQRTATRVNLGTIVSISDGYIGHTASLYSEGPLKVGDTGTGYYDNYKIDGSTKFFLYDSSKPQFGVQQISSSDIMTDEIQYRHGDTAIMYCRSGILRYVYVLR